MTGGSAWSSGADCEGCSIRGRGGGEDRRIASQSAASCGLSAAGDSPLLPSMTGAISPFWALPHCRLGMYPSQNKPVSPSLFVDLTL